VDVTLPGRIPALGRRHPLTIVRDQVEEICTRMGFAAVEGPEVEDEWHCFDVASDPFELQNLGVPACGDLKSLAMSTFRRQPGANTN